MIGGGTQLFDDVVHLVECWIPEKAHDHERKFQSELQDFLDYQLNETGSGNIAGVEPGAGQDHVVSKESGKSYADVAVDDTVGIELKRNLSNDRAKKLRGQIESYLDNYPFVIVCACGIDDMDGWRDLKNKYEGQYGDVMGLEGGGEVAFVHKRRDNYGDDPSDINQGGGDFFGEGGMI